MWASDLGGPLKVPETSLPAHTIRAPVGWAGGGHAASVTAADGRSPLLVHADGPTVAGSRPA